MRSFVLIFFLFFGTLFAENKKDTKQNSYIKITQKELSTKNAFPLTSTMSQISLSLTDEFPDLLANPQKYEGLFYFLSTRNNIPIKAKFLMLNTKILQTNETIYKDMLSKKSSELKTYNQQWFSILDKFIENGYSTTELKNILNKTTIKSIKNGLNELIKSLNQKIELPEELLKIQTQTADITPENVQAILAMKSNLGLATNSDIIKSLKIHMKTASSEQALLYAQTILSLAEHDFDALNHMYEYYKGQKDYQTSSFYLKKLYEISKEYAYQLAITLKQTNELDLAHSIISQEKPTMANLKLKYDIELASNKISEASKTLTTLYESFPTMENKNLLANQLFMEAQEQYMTKELQSSTTNLQKSIALVPTSRAYTLLANIYKETLSDQHKAIQAYKKAYDLQPTKKTAENLNNSLNSFLETQHINDNWLKLFDMLTNLDEAMKYYDKILNSTLSLAQKELIADKYLSLFQSLTDTSSLEKSIKNNLAILETHTHTLALQAKLALDAKDYEDAYLIYKNLVLAKEPFKPQLVETTMLLAKQDPEKSEENTMILTDTLKIIPDDPTLTKYLALTTKTAPPTKDIEIKEETRKDKASPEDKKNTGKNKKSSSLDTAYTLYYENKYQASLDSLTKALEKNKTRQQDVLLTIVLNLQISSQHKVSAVSSWKNIKIDKLSQEKPYDDIFYLLLDLSELLKSINQQESLRAIRTALQLSPNPMTDKNKSKLEATADSNLKNKHYMSAFILYTKLSKIDPQNQIYIQNAGLAAYSNRNYKTAISILTPLPDAPKDILKSSYINLAYIDFNKNNKTEAKTSLLRAKKLGALESDYLNVPSNQTNKAEWETFVQTEALESSEKVIENLENLELMVEQDPNKAIASLLSLEKSYPDNANIYNLLARAYLKKHDWTTAYNYANLSAKADNSPQNKKLLQTTNQNIAFQALNNDDIALAWDSIDKALTYKKDDPYSLAIAGDVKFAMQDIFSAREYWKQANSSMGKPLATLEQKLFKTNFIDSYPKDTDDRIKKIENDKLPNPTHEQKLFFSQTYSEKASSVSSDKAKTYYSTALTYNDKNPLAVANLIKIYENEKDWRYAIYYIQKALRITSNQAQIDLLNTKLSDIYVKYSDDLLAKGQTIDAKSMLHQALKTNPKNTTANEKLKKI